MSNQRIHLADSQLHAAFKAHCRARRVGMADEIERLIDRAIARVTPLPTMTREQRMDAALAKGRIERATQADRKTSSRGPQPWAQRPFWERNSGAS